MKIKNKIKRPRRAGLFARASKQMLAEGGGGEARFCRAIADDVQALEKVFTKLQKAHPGTEQSVGYGAGRPASWRVVTAGVPSLSVMPVT